MRQFERQASWMDELITTTKEALEGKERIIELLQRVANGELEINDEKKEKLALRQDEKGTRAANAIGRVSHLILADSLIQEPNLEQVHKEFQKALLEYQSLMVSANAFQDARDAAKKVKEAKEKLGRGIELGTTALATLQSETDIMMCIRHWKKRFTNYVRREPFTK